MSTLSDQERAVLDHYERGHTRKSIADKLEISSHTVGTYCRRILKKSGARSLAHAAWLTRLRVQDLS